MKIRIILIIGIFFLIANSLVAQNDMQTDTFSFEFEGKKLIGVLDFPTHQKPCGIILIIQGDGKSNVVAGNWFYDMRTQFVKLGYACCAWDKIGCGKSEGKYFQQSVQNNAKEVLCAINELNHRNIPGTNRIGLWGISRAGWICPLVIQKYPSISFWISVSGTDDKESFSYLLETNLKIDGRTESQAKQLTDEWIKGTKAFLTGESASKYLSLTKNLRKDKFYKKHFGPSQAWIIRLAYKGYQKKHLKEPHIFDEESGLEIYVNDFEKVLNNIKCPVLAIFGEKDTRVDWKKTMTLYEKTLGQDSNSILTIKTFADGDHGLTKSLTGAINEKKDKRINCDGYFEAMSLWLKGIK
jgi:uncharacterized protein